MEKKWDTVIPADLKRLFVSGTYTVCLAGHERVKVSYMKNNTKQTVHVKELLATAAAVSTITTSATTTNSTATFITATTTTNNNNNNNNNTLNTTTKFSTW